MRDSTKNLQGPSGPSLQTTVRWQTRVELGISPQVERPWARDSELRHCTCACQRAGAEQGCERGRGTKRLNRPSVEISVAGQRPHTSV